MKSYGFVREPGAAELPEVFEAARRYCATLVLVVRPDLGLSERGVHQFFEKNRHRAKSVVLRDGSEGFRTRTHRGPGGYFTKDGRVVSFWYK